MLGKIGKRTVDALRPSDRDAFLWDTSLKGFGVKITPKGRKVYLVQYQSGGRGSPTRRVTIGAHGYPWTPEQARTHAGTILADVKLGGDPAAVKAKRRREPTVGELCDRYLVEHVEVHNRPSTIAEVRRLIEKRIRTELGRIKISDLSRAKIKEWHWGMKATPYEANRALAYLSKMLSLASHEWELRADNPCLGIKRFAERKRERFFSEEELKRIGEALAATERDGTELSGSVVAVRLLALTGCRVGEVLSWRWEDVDLERGSVRLRDAKAGARTVPLAASAVTVLKSLSRSGPYAVHGHDANKPLSVHVLNKAWRSLRDAAGVPDGRLHDFRHTAGAYAAHAGFNAFLVRDLLGHKTLAMTGRYVERAADPVKASADAFADRVAAAMLGNEGAEVTKLRVVKRSVS